VISKISGPGNIQGSLAYTANNGCVSISDMSFDMAGTYVLQASSTGLLGSSDTITIIDACPSVVNLKVMTYNLLNFPNGRDDCGSNTVVPNRWDTLLKIAQYTLPDVLMVCELQNEIGADKILSEALNVNGSNTYEAADFVENQSTASTEFNNMLYFNQDKLTIYEQN
jgi:hypothetical protein